MKSLRQALAVDAGKTAARTSQMFGRGGGTALPGLVALRLEPNLVKRLSQDLRGGSIVVSGTNGKTTTSRVLGTILGVAGMRPIRNTSGSNLMRGIASTLVSHAGPLGRIDGDRTVVGIFEVDEAALPQVVGEVEPGYVVLLDLFRDQLDRYGEVATVARLWESALKRLPASSRLIANADDPLVANVALTSPVPVDFFGLEDTGGRPARAEHAGDVKACPRCGGAIMYTHVTYGHLGHYECTQCDLKRPTPAFKVTSRVSLGLEGNRFTLETPVGRAEAVLPLPGLYNLYNALAAAATALSRSVNLGQVVHGLSRVEPAFGRMERLTVDGRDVVIALAKNPAGLNEVMRALTDAGERLHLLAMLNDNIADGRDVSWIWDSDVEMLQKHVATVVFSGTRSEDMALRYKYAGLLSPGEVDKWTIEGSTADALGRALTLTPPGRTLVIVPTYTAMLDVRGVLTRLGHARAYWEE